MTLHAAKLPFRRPERRRAPSQLLVARAPPRHAPEQPDVLRPGRLQLLVGGQRHLASRDPVADPRDLESELLIGQNDRPGLRTPPADPGARGTLPSSSGTGLGAAVTGADWRVRAFDRTVRMGGVLCV